MNPVDFTEQLVIRLFHTDAVGVIFYPKIFEIEQELFEKWLEAGGFSLRSMLDGSLAPTPVVRCESDYQMPVRVGDRVTAKLIGVQVGRSGYTLAWTFSVDGNIAMRTSVKRVAIDPKSGASIDLPDAFRKWIVQTQNQTAPIS